MPAGSWSDPPSDPSLSSLSESSPSSSAEDEKWCGDGPVKSGLSQKKAGGRKASAASPERPGKSGLVGDEGGG